MVQRASSSGGAFSLFAEEIINQGGVVFGVKYDENFNVVHGYAETIEGIAAFRQSKYVQSKVGDAFRECKEFIVRGRKVLFSGTPCQIAGLKKFLQKSYDNLYCVDLLCGMVTSPVVWKKYIDYCEHKYKAKIKTIYPRHKNPFWSPVLEQQYMHIIFQDDRKIRLKWKKDLFVRTFFSWISAPYSCMWCKYRTLNRCSDLTLADFWGIDKLDKQMFGSNRGVSLVFVSSGKGVDLFDVVKGRCVTKSYPVQAVHNTGFIRNKRTAPHKNRNVFFQNLERRPFNYLVGKYITGSLARRSYRFVYRCLNKIKRHIKINK
jgi:hypothetical protein